MELNPPTLRIAGLNFEHGSHPLFRGYALALGAGITWLRGENGAGKTTLLKLAAGALTPHAGTIHLDQLEVGARALDYRRHCHYCGGDTPQLPWLTVRELLDLHLSLYAATAGAAPEATASAAAATAAAALDTELRAFHLLHALDQPVTTLSLGQHKKMQLALALALPVRLLLIDEPFNGLDADAMAYLRARLSSPERLARQCIVLTSHLDPVLPLAATVRL